MTPGNVKVLIAELPIAQRLALSYAGKATRLQWLALFALDARLSRIVARATEPMLAQMRLAWWRDELAKDARDRPEGDVLLDLIGQSWAGHGPSLSALVDGWEYLLADGALLQPDAKGFVDGRAEAIVGLAALVGSWADSDAVFAQARYWAAVDLMARLSSDEERLLTSTLIDGFSDQVSILPRSMRPLTILTGLARRAVHRGEREILGSRASVLSGIRLGLLGR